MKLFSSKAALPQRFTVHHQLKTWPRQFQAVWDRLKYFEVRKNDRGFEVFQTLQLHEWAPNPETETDLDVLAGTYTGRWIVATVLHIERGPAFGIQEGYVCMSIIDIARSDTYPEPTLVKVPE